ncbi:hypothetical protein MBLNU13_g09291t1 [Cladosporium sp. NU13]
MDHRFREGVHVRVEYNITATIRIGSDHTSAKQASKVLLVKQPIAPTPIENRPYAVPFPPMTLGTDGMSQRLLSRLRSSSFKFNTKDDVPQRLVRLEMTLPLALSVIQQNTVTCCLTEVTATSDISNVTTFVLEFTEFTLQRRLKWQNLLEDIRPIGATTMRPDVELNADRELVTLPDTLGLRDFMKDQEVPASFMSYKSLIPEVTLEFTMTVTVILKHKASGRRMSSKATLPVVILTSAVEQTMPPVYEQLEATQDTVPPPYEDALPQ